MLTRFAPPVALMALIFLGSAQPSLTTDLGTIDVIGRKLVHMLEYGLLWFLWWRALRIEHPGPSIAITLLYAISDEFHQTFVDGRNGVWTDVMIDAAGVGIAGALVVWRLNRRAGARTGPSASDVEPQAKSSTSLARTQRPR